MRAAGWICLAIAGLLMIPACESGKDTSMYLLPLMLFFLTGFTLLRSAGDFEKAQAAKKSKDLFSFDESSGVLKLAKRDRQISAIIKIVSDRAVNIAYEPEKLNFGAVSVGGVVSGGFYKTGGYNYISSMPKNGKFRMEYNGNTIRSVELSPNLLKIAQNSPLKEFLSGNQIKVIADAYYSDFERQLFLSQVQSTGYASDDLLKRGYPSKEKCMVILSWMAGDI